MQKGFTFSHFIKYSIYFLAFLVIASCKATPEKNLIKHLCWLEGKWERQNVKSEIYEEWIIKDKKELTGESYKIVDGEKNLSETIRLYSDGDDVYYIPTVLDQNEGKPIPFKLVNYDDSNFRFENPQHDYPQFIEYHKKSGTTMEVQIGLLNGVDREIRTFYFELKK